LVRKALDIFTDIADIWGVADAQWGLGRVLHLGGRDAEAVPILQQSVKSARVAGPQMLIGLVLVTLGSAQVGVGELSHAKETLAESLKLVTDVGNREGTARVLEGFAALAVARALFEQGALVFGAAEGVRKSIGAVVWPADGPSHERTERSLRAALGNDAYEVCLLKGIKLRFEDALESARAL
jgi:hypothetical protein